MKRRIEELIDFFRKKEKAGISEKENIKRLKKMGYSGDDIEKAKQIAEDEYESTRARIVSKTRFSRVFSESEKFLLSVEAEGYLISLLIRNIVSEPQLGLIIESVAIEHSSPASLKDIKSIVAKYVSGIDHETGEANSKGIRDIN